MTWVKICGTTNLEDALAAVEAGADAVGFVFYEKSPRNVSMDAARRIVAQLPNSIEKVAVLAGEFTKHVLAMPALGFDALQIYAFSGPMNSGSRNKATGNGGLKVYLALPVNIFLGDPPAADPETFASGGPPELLDTFFLDSGSVQQPGGTGRTFDWAAAAPAIAKLSARKKVVIAGGLNPSNVNDAMRIMQPWGVDVVSGVEARPGKKDPEKVRAFVTAVRDADRKAS